MRREKSFSQNSLETYVLSRKAIAFLMSLLIFMLCVFNATPSFASNKVLSLEQIIEKTYSDNFNRLTLNQQQLMKIAFRKVETNISKDPEGYISMAYMALVTSGADPKAQAVMAAWGVKKYPESTCLLNNLGYALRSLKDNKNAETVYKRVLELDPKRLETIINLGNLYMDTDKDKEAKDCYEKALLVDKDCGKAWEGLWGYYMKKKDYKSALGIADKVLPGGFVERGAKELDEEVAEKNKNPELERIENGDSVEAMDKKLTAISKSKPLTLAPVIEKLDPEMAQKVRDSMENLGVDVEAPETPWPYDFSNLQSYYVSVRGYEDSTTMSTDSMKMGLPQNNPAGGGVDPQKTKDSIKAAAQDYIKEMQESMGQLKDFGRDDANALMDALKAANAGSGTKPSNQAPGGGTAQQMPGMRISDITAKLGVGDKKGMVTTSNYNNYLAHKINFQKYMAQSNKEYMDNIKRIKDAFDIQMNALLEKQREVLAHTNNAKSLIGPYKQQRNDIRYGCMRQFYFYSEKFYRTHVMPAIEEMQDTQALYIKNMSNKKLKEKEAGEMKTAINSYLSLYASSQAPVDAYEPPVGPDEESAADKSLKAQIDKVKAQAPKAGEPLPQIKEFETEQKTLLQKVYEDTKYESSIGLVKLTYENAELTLGLNDPIHQKYMDLGVNLKELSVSLTEGGGSEVSFQVAEGVKGTKLEGIEAKVGWSVRQPGRKTTIFFDDNFNAVDAKITSTPGSEGFSAEAGAGSVSVEGSIKIESTAEGTSEFVSGLKASVKDITILESKYKESLTQ